MQKLDFNFGSTKKNGPVRTRPFGRECNILSCRKPAMPAHNPKNALQIYSWATPNGHKVHILLHELGLKPDRDFILHPVNIGAGDQFQPDFLAISPNNKIP
ncbi:hypothetical protein RZS08_42630, partial [Arthrospira platensis SPKY1]|nr:hypothetical protein [Arthrospira platensis SPKY1]